MCRMTGTPSMVGSIQEPTWTCMRSRNPWPATASSAAANIRPCTTWNGYGAREVPMARATKVPLSPGSSVLNCAPG